jgi:alkanesulfonate monooxygenase SsuD/methylene tetrahydromethanopterin reductase-like flavin-dependent oxidoreductase (luciferase family)
MTRRGFGVAGALDHGIVREVARAVEAHGYATFWANDTPAGDGLAALAVAAKVTRRIQLAVGVIAVDRRSPTEIADRVRELSLPHDRLIIGLGSGQKRKGALELVRAAIEELGKEFSVPILVGALGPKMCRMSATSANGALLNWLTPAKAMETRELMLRAAQEQGRPEPRVLGYVRTALGEASLVRLREEAARYERVPQYGRHFRAMGASGVQTSVYGDSASDLKLGLASFDGILDETVVRAITAEETTRDYLGLVEAGAL